MLLDDRAVWHHSSNRTELHTAACPTVCSHRLFPILPCCSCLVLSCLVLSCLVLPCLVLSCLVLSCLVLSCLVLSCLVACFVSFFLRFVVFIGSKLCLLLVLGLVALYSLSVGACAEPKLWPNDFVNAVPSRSLTYLCFFELVLFLFLHFFFFSFACVSCLFFSLSLGISHRAQVMAEQFWQRRRSQIFDKPEADMQTKIKSLPPGLQQMLKGCAARLDDALRGMMIDKDEDEDEDEEEEESELSVLAILLSGLQCRFALLELIADQ